VSAAGAQAGTPTIMAAGPAAACLGAFDLAIAPGYGSQTSNRVVDAIGDLAGGVRLHRERRDGGEEAAP